MDNTFSPATFLGLIPFMMHTDSMTIFTPTGGLCMARTSTTSFLFKDFKLARAASYIKQRQKYRRKVQCSTGKETYLFLFLDGSFQ